MKCHFIVSCVVALIAIVGQTFAQEENGVGNYVTKTTSNEIDETNTAAAAAAADRTPTPVPIAVKTRTHTLTPAIGDDEPFLLLRPLHNIQVSLFGNLDSSEQERLLVVLKSLLQQTLYRSMVEHFIPQLDKGKMDNVFIGRMDMTRKHYHLDLSILSKVFLDWTVTNFTLGNEPGTNILQASGTLGFTKYDYALLHPQTILPLEEEIIASGNTTTETEQALRMKGFSLQVLELAIVETEEVPTPSTTLWRLGDDQHMDLGTNDAKKGHHRYDFDNVALHSSDTSTTNAIRTALIVASIVSAVALCLFLWFVRIKSNRIKKDILSRKKRLSTKKIQDSVNFNEGIDDMSA